jgi:hypothetical protein
MQFGGNGRMRVARRAQAAQFVLPIIRDIRLQTEAPFLAS